MPQDKSRADADYSVEDMKKEMCRYVDAAKNGGFDGKEHPENIKIVNAVLDVLWPLTPEQMLIYVKR